VQARHGRRADAARRCRSHSERPSAAPFSSGCSRC